MEVDVECLDQFRVRIQRKQTVPQVLVTGGRPRQLERQREIPELIHGRFSAHPARKFEEFAGQHPRPGELPALDGSGDRPGHRTSDHSPHGRRQVRRHLEPVGVRARPPRHEHGLVQQDSPEPVPTVQNRGQRSAVHRSLHRPLSNRPQLFSGERPVLPNRLRRQTEESKSTALQQLRIRANRRTRQRLRARASNRASSRSRTARTAALGAPRLGSSSDGMDRTIHRRSGGPVRNRTWPVARQIIDSGKPHASDARDPLLRTYFRIKLGS